VAALSIFKWNVLGFQIVVFMSALHFGFGDASFLAESGAPKMNRITEVLYSLSAGSLPVVIPLVNSKSTSALKEVNPHLVGWAHGATYSLQVTVWALTAIAVMALLFQKRYRDLLDVILLALLAVTAPPLVAFAIYFGCWHATRHTARLTLLLPPSITPIWSAVKAGLPALVGTVIVALGIAFFNPRGFTTSLLWSLLIVVWALTVPHMMTTARFDLRSLK
jgi:Brp/Blh family beta-carotene 15,15'-monooxygenase